MSEGWSIDDEEIVEIAPNICIHLRDRIHVVFRPSLFNGNVCAQSRERNMEIIVCVTNIWKPRVVGRLKESVE